MERRNKIIFRLSFSPFAQVNEKSFEDWVDKASELVTRYRVCAPIFQEAWASAANNDIAGIISRVEMTYDHEEVVAAVSRELFPFNYYVKELEELLMKGQWQDSVMMTRLWARTYVSRYCRLCERHEYPIMLSEMRLMETVMRSLPERIERILRF